MCLPVNACMCGRGRGVGGLWEEEQKRGDGVAVKHKLLCKSIRSLNLIKHIQLLTCLAVSQQKWKSELQKQTELY